MRNCSSSARSAPVMSDVGDAAAVGGLICDGAAGAATACNVASRLRRSASVCCQVVSWLFSRSSSDSSLIVSDEPAFCS